MSSLLAAKPRAQPALCLCSILGHLLVEPVNSSIEILASLASELLTPSPGLVPLVLRLNTQRVVLCLGLSAVLVSLVLRLTAVLLGLVLCLLGVGPEVCLSFLCLGAGTVGL